jgi:hypothetical protein
MKNFILIVISFLYMNFMQSSDSKKLLMLATGSVLTLYGGDQIIDDFFGSEHCNKKWDKRLNNFLDNSPEKQKMDNFFTFGYFVAPLYKAIDIAFVITGLILINKGINYH